MNPSLRNALLVVGLLAVAATVGLLALLDEDPAERPGQVLRGPERDPSLPVETRSDPRDSSGMRSLARESRDLAGRAELTVEVYAPDGTPLYRALVEPTVLAPSDDGLPAPIPRLQPARWRGLAPGEVRLDVECDGYLPHSETVALEADESHQVRVTLVPFGRVSGTVSSPTGRPMSAEIWFLEADQRHPETPMEARDLTRVNADRYGRFEFEFPEKRTVHVSVGSVGKPELEDRGLFVIGPGVHKTLDVVLADSCQVDVEVAGIPPVGEDGRSGVIVAVERREGTRGQRRARGGEARGDEDGLEEEAAERGEREEPGPQAVQPEEWWRPVARGEVDADGRITFHVDRPGPEHRLVVFQGRGRHVSSTTFGLRRGRPVTVFTSLPFVAEVREPVRPEGDSPSLRVEGERRVIGVGRGRDVADGAARTERKRWGESDLAISVSPRASSEPVRAEGLYWGDA